MTVETTTAVAPAANGANSMTAIQVVEKVEALQKLGQIYAASGFFGAVSASCATASVINAALEGISPLEYRAKYHTFEDGTTSVKSDYIQREFHRLGGDWDFKEWTGEVCDMVFTYKGKTLPLRVTIDEFKANKVAVGKDGKLKTNWAKFPREMLKARCMATAIRAICPEALGGMYTQEEVADFERKPPQEAKPAAVSPSPLADAPKSAAEKQEAAAEVVEAEVVDYEVCPCGKAKGKRFDELDTETLRKILAAPTEKFPLVTADHKNAIIAIVAKRETDGEGK